jgi:GR25 family glycosyltransferase involved in LPS biosynthesis
MVLREFVKGSKEFLLLLEDDVALSHNFAEQLQAAVYTWITKTSGPHGILRVGYLPMMAKVFLDSKFTTPWSHETHTHEFTTGIENVDKDNANVVRSGVTTLALGSQAVLYTRHAAQELLKILDAPTLLEVQQRLKAIPYPFPSSSWPLAWDHLLYISCGEMAFVHPPLAIEADLSGSSINSTSPVTRWGHASANGFLDESQYFGAPAWKAAYIATLKEENESAAV